MGGHQASVTVTDSTIAAGDSPWTGDAGGTCGGRSQAPSQCGSTTETENAVNTKTMAGLALLIAVLLLVFLVILPRL